MRKTFVEILKSGGVVHLSSAFFFLSFSQVFGEVYCNSSSEELCREEKWCKESGAPSIYNSMRLHSHATEIIGKP